MRNAKGVDFRIEMDGGIDLETVGPAARAGVENVRGRQSVFGKGDPARNVEDATEERPRKRCCSAPERRMKFTRPAACLRAPG